MNHPEAGLYFPTPEQELHSDGTWGDAQGEKGVDWWPSGTNYRWPREDILRCVGPGWKPLVEECLRLIGPGASVHQVKEKFGGLRFYYSAPGEVGDEIYDLVHEQENASFKICEECGEAGLCRAWGGYWISTRCKKHAIEELERCGWPDRYDAIATKKVVSDE